MTNKLSHHLAETAKVLNRISKRIELGEKPDAALPQALSVMRKMLDNMRDHHIRNAKMSGLEMAAFWNITPGRVSQIRNAAPEEISASATQEKMKLLILMAEVALTEEADVTVEELRSMMGRYEEMKEQR